MAVDVRVAGDGDLAALSSLRRAWNEERAEGPIHDPTFDARFQAWVVAESATRTFFVASIAGEPVGMANVKRYDRMPVVGRTSAGWWGYVGNVFVLPAHRDAGVGSALMQAVHDWARAEGMEHLRLAPSARAWRFYERLGYRGGTVVELDP